MRAGLLAGLLLAPAAAVQGQSALEIVRKLDAIEARMNELETAPSASADQDRVERALAEMRLDIRRLGSDVDDVRVGSEEPEVRAQLQALAEELATVKSAVEAPRDQSREAELADALAEMRAYIAHAEAREAEAREAEEEEGPLTLTGRVQAQYNTTSDTSAIASEFMIRRARLTAELRINDIVTGKVQPDFGEGKISLKDAYVAFDFAPVFGMTVGQFKRPFDLFELTSSTKILTIERAGVVRGVSTCAGPGGICSYSRFTEKLGFSDRDIGVRFDGTAGDWTWQAAITNGEGANHDEVNDGKSFGARLVYAGLPNLAIGANVAAHDYTNEVDPGRKYAGGYGVDVEWGSFSGGWHAQAGAVTGDNWRNLDVAGAPSRFRTAQGVLTYRFQLGTAALDAIEPLARFSWADPDTDVDNDHEMFLTGGVVAHFVGRNKIAFNVERWMPSSGAGQWSMKVQSYLHF